MNMNKNVLVLYDKINKNKKIVSKIQNMEEEKFLSNKECLNYGFGLVSEIKEYLLKLNREILINNDILSKMSKEMYIFDECLLNCYKSINGYMVYDFLKNEYNVLLEELNKILQI